jgi:hypothetical protein
MTKIRVNPSNSKVLAGTLFITELKALLVSKSKVLAELIEYDNNILFKGTKLVEYNGPYIRLKK